MSRSLSLAAYLALRRGQGPETSAGDRARPPGPLLWCHASTPDRVATAAVLAARLAATGGAPAVLVTAAAAPEVAPPADLILEPIPPDLRGAARAFLEHWRPDLLLWLGGALRPALLAESAERGTPRLLADIWAPEIGIEGGSWLPGVTRPLLCGFDAVFAANDEALHRLRRAGVDRLEMSGPLDVVGPALPFSERDRVDAAASFGTRPAWLAAGLPLGEVAAVADAHRHAARRSHRLMLVAVPAEDVTPEALLGAFRETGLLTASRADGEDPTEEHQVLVADSNGEMGLWYRMAPVTYLAGTLSGTGCRSPFEAAALGSALIIGPKTRPQDGACRRLAGRGAALRVRFDSELGPALEQMIAPDRAATLAATAWDEATRGAAATDRLLEAIRERLAVPA